MTRSLVEKSQSAGTAVDDPLLAIVRELGSELHLRDSALRSLSLHTAIEEDLGLDSLARIELLSRVERRFSVRLSTEAMADVTTLADLRNAIVRANEGAGPQLVKEVSGLVLDKADTSPMSCETLPEVLEWHLNAHPDRPHIQLYDEAGEGERLSFRDLYEGAYALARGMQEDGLNSGDRVAIMLPTGKDYFLAFFGALLAGGVPVSLYPPTRPSQLEEHLRRHKKILENCGATRLIAFKEVRPFARLLKAQLPSLRRVHGVGEMAQPATAPSAMAQPKRASLPRLRGKDVAFLQYTSGSTGNPKGVILSHANLLSNIRSLGERMQVDSRDVIVSWLPLYHDMGLIGCWLGSLYYSCLFVVMSPLDFIAHPERWLWAIHRYRGTISAAPNFAYELCLKRIDDAQLEGLDLSSWRVACNGAEAVSPQTVRRFIQRFQPYGFRERSLMPVYGLAENSVGLAFPPLGRPPLIDRIQRDGFSKTGKAEPASPDDRNALEFVACGSPLKSNEIRIVDELNRELPQRQEGRLQFRGPSATSGYFQNPAETRKLFQGSWLNSGDRAYMAERDVVITGRSKDIVIHGGRNLYPEELEAAVGDIPGIRKGCVAVFGSKEFGSKEFGSKDPHSATEKLVVLAETRAVDRQAKEALRSSINLRAVDIIGMPPDDVVLVPPHTVLKTSSGKIRRSANREQYEHGKTAPKPRSLSVQITRLLASAIVPQCKRAGRIAGAVGYGCWFWSVCAVLAPFIWLSVVVTPVLSWRWTVMRAWGRLLFGLLGIRITVEGLQRLPPEDMRCLYAANHSSYLDAFVLITAFPRNIAFVAKAELKNHWLSRTALDKIKAVYVNRMDRRQSAEDAKRLIERAQAGERLFFFPEGTFTRVSGVYPFHMGAFLTAVKAKSAIVPIAIRGTRIVLRPGDWLPRRAPVTIIVDNYLPPPAAPLLGESLPEDAQWQAAVRLRDQSRASILKNSGEPDLAEERPPIFFRSERGTP